MQALLIKMSSMGDILHTFPALTDLQQHRPDVHLHWVVEKPFAAMAAWHPNVQRVIPIQQRKWLRERNLPALVGYRQWRRSLRSTTYDLVLDSQSLIKSALFARQARRSGPIHGRHPADIREKLAGWLYSRRHRVAPCLHAIDQARQLFGATFGYVPAGEPDFGIRDHVATGHSAQNQPPVLLIPGTTWPDKHWHLPHWQAVAQRLSARALPVEIIWGTAPERAMAEQIVAHCPEATFARERLSIDEVAGRLVHARAVIGTDTGFSHIAGALGTPTTALYGPTSPARYGVVGPTTRNLSMQLACQPCHKRHCRFLPRNDGRTTPPCMIQLTPDQVLDWNILAPDGTSDATPIHH